ncbi:MAG: pyridoxal-phosphate dependent enzyme [Pseudomonadota bacterium]
MLFKAYPGLEGHIPWVSLVNAPTPVSRLEKLSVDLGRDIWIKRDDLTSADYGGNKPRKLEFLLAEAGTQNKKTLVTAGGLGTNHGLATAIMGRKLGFQVRLGLFEQPVTGQVLKHLRLFKAFGAEMKLCGRFFEDTVEDCLGEEMNHPEVYFIPLGGSNALGTLGFVNASLELAEQVKKGRMPLPEAIFVAAGTCSSFAGLLLGTHLAGLDTKVIGVRVTPEDTSNPDRVMEFIQGAGELMRRHDPAVPERPITRDDVLLDHDQLGDGYAHVTGAGQAALEAMARRQSIRLDLTYTAKTLAALLNFVRTGPGRGPLLFWNTYNSVDLSAVADKVDHRSLPREFHRFFEPV